MLKLGIFLSFKKVSNPSIELPSYAPVLPYQESVVKTEFIFLGDIASTQKFGYVFIKIGQHIDVFSLVCSRIVCK